MLLQFIALDVLGDLCYTMYHYSAHKLPWLWKYHKVHHEKIYPAARDTFHIHPVDLVLSTLTRIAVPLALVGPDTATIAVFAAFSTMIGYAHHSNTRLAHWASCGFVPGRVWASYHLTHHRRPGVNFAGAYWLWDYMLGTAVYKRIAR